MWGDSWLSQAFYPTQLLPGPPHQWMAGQQRTETIAVQIWKVLGSRPLYFFKTPTFWANLWLRATLWGHIENANVHTDFYSACTQTSEYPGLYRMISSVAMSSATTGRFRPFLSHFARIDFATTEQRSPRKYGQIAIFHKSLAFICQSRSWRMIHSYPFIFTGSSGPSSASAQNSELLRAARQSQERHFAWQKSESNATSHQTNWWHKPFLAARVCFRKKSFHVWTMFQKGQHAAQVSG